MPELPEVETIKLGLQKRIVGLRVKEIKINSDKSFIGDKRLVEGKQVLNILRRAKVLGINLDNNLTLLFHLKMSGQLIYIGNNKFIGGHPTKDMKGEMPNKHTRVEFILDDNSKLYFNDQRKFGWIKVIEGDLGNMGYVNNLGPEPLEKSFSLKVFKENLLKHKKTSIKIVLLDQSVVAGVGNIYANEACFVAHIDPRKKVMDMEDREFKKLHLGVIKVIKDGIKYGGSSKTHFVDAEGKKGFFLDHAFVYGKNICKVCKTKLQKIKLGGRGTFFCPNCQS